MSEYQNRQDARVRPKEPFGIKWPNLIEGTYADLASGPHASDSGEIQDHLFRIELDTFMTAEEGDGLHELLLDKATFGDAARRLSDIRRRQNKPGLEHFIHAAFSASQAQGCLAVIPSILLGSARSYETLEPRSAQGATRTTNADDRAPRVRLEWVHDHNPEVDPKPKLVLVHEWDDPSDVFPIPPGPVVPPIPDPPFNLPNAEMLSSLRKRVTEGSREDKILCALLDPDNCTYTPPPQDDQPSSED